MMRDNERSILVGDLGPEHESARQLAGLDLEETNLPRALPQDQAAGNRRYTVFCL